MLQPRKATVLDMIQPASRSTGSSAEWDPKLKFPPPRSNRTDIINPSFDDLFRLSLLRVCGTIDRNHDRPPVLFPLAESYCQRFFTHDEWVQFGDLETELARMNYTLSCFPERGVPAALSFTLQLLLYCSPILQNWKRFVPTLRSQVAKTVRDMVSKMQDSLSTTKKRNPKSAFLAEPLNYDIIEDLSDVPHQLWKRSINELAFHYEKGTCVYAREFLQIHAFVKDPIGGLERSFDSQITLFNRLITAFQAHHQDKPVSPPQWKLILAQAAQESSYLVSPHLEQVAYVHFSGHQQLPYVYIPLDNLPRSEFSTPQHALDMVQEILLSESDDGTFSAAPITIASYPRLFKQGRKPMTIIIDGNHRVTAIALLRFLTPELLNLNKPSRGIELRKYCRKHGFGEKWEVDLMEVMDELLSCRGAACLDLIRSRADRLGLFDRIAEIPALVVQEESFHTLCAQRSSSISPSLLLPVHQALFSDDVLGFALPNAGQLHGRPLSFKTMPLLRI